MSKEIPWIQVYPYYEDAKPDDVPGTLPDSITEDELQKLLDAGAEFITQFDTPNPFTAWTTLTLRIGQKQFMTKVKPYGIEDMFIHANEMNADIEKAITDLLRAALNDLVAFGHDGKSA